MTDRSQSNEPLLLRISEVAKLTGFGVSTLYAMCKNNELPCVRKGRSVRVSRRSLERWIAEREAHHADGVRGLEEYLATRSREGL